MTERRHGENAQKYRDFINSAVDKALTDIEDDPEIAELLFQKIIGNEP